EVLRLLGRRQVRRRSFQPLDGDAVILGQIAFVHLRVLLGKLALEQVIGVLAKLRDVLGRHESPNHHETVAPEADIILDRHAIAIRTYVSGAHAHYYAMPAPSSQS